MRNAAATLSWLVGDHPSTNSGQALGSTSKTANASGTLTATTLYKPLHCFQGRLWGEVRYQSGTIPTNYTYTGQYSHTADFGLMYYNARWYDPALGRMAQADTLVPGAGNPMAWDKYCYTYNNPLTYTDPSGHWPDINWSFSTSAIAQTVVSAFGMSSDTVAQTLSNAGTVLDIAAGVLDAAATGYVAGVTIATSGAGWLPAEAAASPLVVMGNVLAGIATVATVASEAITGNTGVSCSFSANSSGFDYHQAISIGSGTGIGVVTAAVGAFPMPAAGSLVIQSATILNDFGVPQAAGWYSDPVIYASVGYSTMKPNKIPTQPFVKEKPNNIYLPVISNGANPE
jgi:RHS repeat-associated protein